MENTLIIENPLIFMNNQYIKKKGFNKRIQNRRTKNILQPRHTNINSNNIQRQSIPNRKIHIPIQQLLLRRKLHIQTKNIQIYLKPRNRRRKNKKNPRNGKFKTNKIRQNIRKRIRNRLRKFPICKWPNIQKRRRKKSNVRRNKMVNKKIRSKFNPR